MLLLCLLVLPAWAQGFGGTYTANGPAGVVTLQLSQDAQGAVSGTFSGNGASFQVQGTVQDGALMGLATGDGGMVYLVGELQGTSLLVTLADVGPGGQPNLMSAQQVMMTRGTATAAPASPPASTFGSPAAPPAPAPAAASAEDKQVAQFLMANAWCAFSYNSNTGASATERIQFSADGTVAMNSGAETYTSGSWGSVAGQYGGGGRSYWRVSGGQLQLSQDRAQWVVQPLSVTRNSNGYPIVKSGGKEYMVCN